MLDILYPWCVGVLVFTVSFYVIGALLAPLFEWDLPPGLAWVGWVVDRTITLVNVTMSLSLAAVAALGVTYGCYRLGLLVTQHIL